MRLPGEEVAAGLVAELAKEVMSLDARIKNTDADIEEVSDGLCKGCGVLTGRRH